MFSGEEKLDDPTVVLSIVGENSSSLMINGG